MPESHELTDFSTYTALVFDAHSSRWLGFKEPDEIITTNDLEQVRPKLALLETRRHATGMWALGWITYEASPAFDQAIETHPSTELPLIWFGLYSEPTVLNELPYAPPSKVANWIPSITEAEYASAIAAVRERILQGDTYQVNFTFRMRAEAPKNAYQLFYQMVGAQAGAYSFFINAGRFVVLSASPELFF